tara:strand:- start:98 stop:571 length:474 start_codon:yes stop_codon:yes gene_type:complete
MTNVCSICLDNSNLKMCNYCNNYVHIDCLSNYIKSNYKSIILKNSDTISIQCFICKNNDCGFILTKNRFNNIFNDTLIEEEDYINHIRFIINIMIYNNVFNHDLLFEILLKRIIESKDFLYNKVDIFKNKMKQKIISYKNSCNSSKNLKMINYILTL